MKSLIKVALFFGLFEIALSKSVEEIALDGSVQIEERAILVEPDIEPEPVNEIEGFVNFEILPDELFTEILDNITRYRSTRIVYGSIASTNQFPYYSYLVIYRPGYQTFCGSSLISTQWVTTAAHCVRDFLGAQAYMGSINKNSMPVKRTASGYYVHEDWQASTLANDISLVKLVSPVTTSNSVNIVPLPSRADISKSYDGTVLVSCGFGKTETSYPNYLNYAYINGISDRECANVHWVFKTTMLCAKGLNSLTSICFGDSGGPLVHQSSTGSKLVGINSFVQTDYCFGDVQGFTRVDRYLDWISLRTGIAISYN